MLKKNIGNNCKVCTVCNGLGCGNTMPGPGSKAPGNGLEKRVWNRAIESGRNHSNNGIPVFNPTSVEDTKTLMDLYKGGILPPAMCVVVDSAGLPHLRQLHAGIECYLNKIKTELIDTMYMCGARKISDITEKMVRRQQINWI